MPAPSLLCVATYERTVAAPVERVWENVHDWEHLPWLHSGSFSSIECLDSGPWGWRARIGLQPGSETILLELVVDDGRSRYVSRTLEGGGAGTEIWTDVDPVDPTQTRVRVGFWLPDVAPLPPDGVGAAGLGKALTELYTRLWDEDESMMVRRTRELAARRSRGARRLELGPIAALRDRLPMTVELCGRPWRLLDLDGELFVHSGRCPHQLGPLDADAPEAGVVTCPWHGYRFDLRTGRSCDGRVLRLDPAPHIEIDDNGGAALQT
jgi:nitrite reductase/ring-hydroxylating ferredoxin subunit